jgi:hypothetical protein
MVVLVSLPYARIRFCDGGLRKDWKVGSVQDLNVLLLLLLLLPQSVNSTVLQTSTLAECLTRS